MDNSKYFANFSEESPAFKKMMQMEDSIESVHEYSRNQSDM